MLDNVRQQHLGCHFRGRVWRNDAGIDGLTGGCHQIGHIVFADVARPVGRRLHQPLDADGDGALAVIADRFANIAIFPAVEFEIRRQHLFHQK